VASHRVRVGDVDLVQRGPAGHRRIEIRTPAGGQIVDHLHLVSGVEQRIDEVGADEPGSAGHKGAHGRPS
jgi:hypothetical protein